MTNKEKYIVFCEQKNIYIPIFSQYWWLEAVSMGNWDVILAEENNNILAVNPYYYLKENNDIYEIRKAPLTQNNGVLFNYPKEIKYEKKLSFERKVLQMIIGELEKKGLKKYRQYFHYSFLNWLPYYWKGYKQTTRYTYVINECNMEIVNKNMNSKLRNQIKKAESIVEIRRNMNIIDFYNFNKKTYERQNMEIPYSLDIVCRIEEECNKRNASKILYAIDKENNLHAAIYLIEDEESVYYLLSGSDEKYRNSQALSILIYNGIKYAVEKGKKFDFEGSMKQNIEMNFSQFGCIQTPYMDISKEY